MQCHEFFSSKGLPTLKKRFNKIDLNYIEPIVKNINELSHFQNDENNTVKNIKNRLTFLKIFEGLTSLIFRATKSIHKNVMM